MVWNARLRIIKRSMGGQRVQLKGYFDWNSADKKVSGREFVRGRSDRRTGRVEFHGYAVRQKRGEIMKTNYVGHLTRSGRSILRGRWSGNEVVGGKWNARWLGTR